MKDTQKENHIFYANNEELNEIKQLWDICFPESPEFSDWYFENIFQVEKTLLYKENGIICSMLQEINFEFYDKTKNKNATYIYGACTHPLYRKRGLMGKLLNQSFFYDKKNGIDFSVLIPENKELFKFYEKFGYEPTTKIKTELFFKDNKDISNDYIFKVADLSDIENMNNLYFETQKNVSFLIRNFEYWKIQLKMFTELGGFCFCLYNKVTKQLEAYAFVWNETSLFAQEIIFVNEKSKNEICKNILNYVPKQTQLKLNIYSLKGDYTACIKSYKKETETDYLINMLYN